MKVLEHCVLAPPSCDDGIRTRYYNQLGRVALSAPEHPLERRGYFTQDPAKEAASADAYLRANSAR